MRNKNVAFHQSKVDVTTSASLILNKDPNRTYFLIQNMGDGSVYLNFSGDAVVGEGVLLDSGDAYEPYTAPVNEVSVISNSTATIVVVEA